MATVKCCKCGTDNHFDLATEFPGEQTMAMEIAYTGAMLKAETVWASIQNTEKLLVSAGSDYGYKTRVSIKEISQTDGKFLVVFFVEAKNND